MTPPEIHQAAANRINHQARRVEEMRQWAALTPGWFGRGVLHGANLAFITHSEISQTDLERRMARALHEQVPILLTEKAPQHRKSWLVPARTSQGKPMQISMSDRAMQQIINAAEQQNVHRIADVTTRT